MPQPKSQEDLRRFLISSRLIKASEWNQAARAWEPDTGVAEILEILERRQVLSNLQTGRILKGDTDGLVLGDYKLLYRNASGSFARVYRAAHVDTGQMVGLKLLRDRWAVDPQAVDGFHREAKICQRFKHPNIVPIYDVGSSGRFHFFTMEFVEGGNLRDFMKLRRKLTPAEACTAIYEICSGLNYALTLGATHRDLKLTNVLMSSDGVAKLVDFGLAGADTNSFNSAADDVHRALEYAALEKGTNAPDNDPRSDIFFAGAIFHELLSGEPAWKPTKDREERRQLSRYTNCTPIRNLVPDLPDQIVDVLERMLKVSPHDRYQAASEAMADLKQILISLGEWNGPEEVDPNAKTVVRDHTLLIVDSLKKRMTALKDYFTKHGLKATFTNDPEAALTRLKSKNPPDGVLILADQNTDSTLNCFAQFQAYGRSRKVPCLAVFPAELEGDVNQKIRSSKFGATKFQPATLREIREHFMDLL